jgi:MFS family permease
MGFNDLLSKRRLIADSGFNRWHMLPTTLLIHLCIGLAYGFSVFLAPMMAVAGSAPAVACSARSSFFSSLISDRCGWNMAMLSWIFAMFFVSFGSATALWGPWLARVGARKAIVYGALAWSGGMALAALGVYLHRFVIVWLGLGLLGGIGIGLAYISPLPALSKWFPDKPLMATALAFIGFGGGAMIGSPLAHVLITGFATANGPGVWQAMLLLSIAHLGYMLVGAFIFRVPSVDWPLTMPQLHKNVATERSTNGRYVHAKMSLRLPQLWFMWMMLMLNIAVGLGIISLAAPFLLDVFGGKLIGLNQSFKELSDVQTIQVSAIAASFAGLIAISNIAGLFIWPSLPTYLGAKWTYTLLFATGLSSCWFIPQAAHAGQVPFFAAGVCLLLSIYGGGFATLPAYIAEVFGHRMAGAIHGHMRKAWATAALVGPIGVNYVHQYEVEHGVPVARSYDTLMYMLGGFMLIAMLCNWLIRPVAEKSLMSTAELAALDDEERAMRQRMLDDQRCLEQIPYTPAIRFSGGPLKIFPWIMVVVPSTWGIFVTLQAAAKLLK